MSRFVRDEKRTYPFAWLVIGGLFAVSSVWAVYAEMVTRVPWQVHQDAFFDLELRLATENLERLQAEWEAAIAQEPLKSQVERLAQLEQEMHSGAYAQAKQKLAELDKAYAEAEIGKTFGASDLDETYYYRNLAEYDRDAAQVKVRKLYKAAYPQDARGTSEPAKIYRDPPAPPREEGESKASHHLRTEIARMEAHIRQAQEVMAAGPPAEVVEALEESMAAERAVADKLTLELKHQHRIDEAEAAMRAIDGPHEPIVSEKDPAKADAALQAARAAACAPEPETRNCVKWLLLGPVDVEHKQLTIAVNKAKRPLLDAELRFAKAKERAEPSFDPNDPLKALIGPFQIEQIVYSWMAVERDVDLQQVDRCHTCHMGVNSSNYSHPSVTMPFRTHPMREQLMAAHPIDKFGCTACHQGQGRATDDKAHSKWVLEVHHGKERWHYAGDHYWEDPLLPTGKLTKIIIDGKNDTLEVTVGRSGKKEIKLDHQHPTKTFEEDEYPEEQLFADLQTKLQEVVDADEDVKAAYKAVVRKRDNRLSIGLEKLDPAVKDDKPPKVTIHFPKIALAEMLGFGHTRTLEARDALMFTAPMPMVQPVRAANPQAQGTIVDTPEEYSYVPPNGAHGLQVPDDMRNRMINALPEIEAGCLRCHHADTDFVPRRSQFQHVVAKLDYQEREASLKADAAAYQAAHGTTDLPEVPAAAGELHSLAPTLEEGRSLFRQLNCTGCHLLEGFDNNPNHGPQLNDISAKVTPEWLLSWLRHPRGWRAKTSMPNLWPRPLDPASKLPYAEGSPEYERWDKERTEETIAIAAYLFEMSENPGARPGSESASPQTPLRETIAGYASVPGASAAEGEQLFASYGCQGCHATIDGGKELPEPWRARERDIAPTLSNLKDKLASADWVAYWVEDPSRYWSHTAMPNLRLSRKEAASIALYLGGLASPPASAAEVTADEVKLVADAKERQALAPCTALGGREVSRVACGAKVIENRGCYGCHQIDGFEKFAPIGPELTGFAKKDITTLDYGYAIADHHLQTTETFAALKLDAPRIFARDRIELKMGDFDMSSDEIRALTLFLKALVPNKAAEAYDPVKNETYAAAIRGRQLVDDLNCRGCHIIEGKGGDVDGWRVAVLTQDPQQRAPFLDGEGARVQPEWLFNFLRNPAEHGIRPWLHPEWAYGDEVPADKRTLRMPTFNLTPDQWTDIVRYFSAWDGQPYPYQVPKVHALSKAEKLWTLKNMNEEGEGKAVGICMSCHFYEEFPVERARGDLKKQAPDLANVRKRLRPEWVKTWILRPQNYLPYTSMTAFFASVDRDKDAGKWPREADPFISPLASAWEVHKPAELPSVSPERHAEMLRDLLFSIPDGAPWPKPGQEASSVIVDPNAPPPAVAEAEALPAGEQPGG